MLIHRRPLGAQRLDQLRSGLRRDEAFEDPTHKRRLSLIHQRFALLGVAAELVVEGGRPTTPPTTITHFIGAQVGSDGKEADYILSLSIAYCLLLSEEV